MGGEPGERWGSEVWVDGARVLRRSRGSVGDLLLA